MNTRWKNLADDLSQSKDFVDAKATLLKVLTDASRKITGVKDAASSEIRARFLSEVDEIGKLRGRPLYYPAVTSGLGNGPLLELLDGSVKYDMITGIGINFLGHSHPIYMEEAVHSATCDVMQGNLQPGRESSDLMKAVLSRVGKGSRLRHGWIACSGTMVNEIAIKIIRQKKNPATKVLAFRDCFAGRSTTMQEITDNPAYREGQPVYGEVAYLPFFDPAAGLEASVGATLGELKSQLEKHPGKFACLMIEPVQGEGGFLHAPREWYVKVFEAARNAGLAIWADEIQTFVRTGELFAYQKLGLNEYIDVCTIGKLLQSCMVLYSEEFNPKPGLVAGTFSGSTIAMRAARRTIEFLESGGYFGPQGKIEKLSDRFRTGLDRLAATTCKGLVGERRVFGGMIAFTAFDGKMDSIKKLVMRMFDLGVMAYTCGHGPYFVRFLPPLGAMSEAQVDEVVSIVERAVTETK